jgi:uncharacterized repeat protein (TIGR02543 family)
VRIKADAARSKIATIVSVILLTSLFVSIPTPASANNCVPIETTAANGEMILTFTTVGVCNWTAPAGVTSVRVLVVGGGGSGSAGINSYYWPAGGGGGEVITDSNVTVTPNTSVTIEIGAGGAAVTSGPGADVNNGKQSSFGTLVARGGKTPNNSLTSNAGATGGASGSSNPGGFGGTNGSFGCGVANCGTGGGGGAGGNGTGLNGGAGVDSDISGTTVGYGGGGAGHNGASGTATAGGATQSVDAPSNRGGGGAYLKAGGSGVVIVRYTATCVLTETVASNGDTIVSFTTVGRCNWQVPTGISTADLLVVGGGGAGGTASNGAGGGGGGGQVNAQTGISISGTVAIQIGAGGVAQTTASATPGGNGGISSFTRSSATAISAIGGSGGASVAVNAVGSPGATGFNGGGGSVWAGNVSTTNGSNGVGGFKGGSSFPSSVDSNIQAGGGGGGSGGNGVDAISSNGGAGGVGVSNSLTGSAIFYGGGGGGGKRSSTGTAGAGGNGGGGNGGRAGNGAAATANTGGGGGGGGGEFRGGAGGSGVVVLKYATPDGFSALRFNANGGTGSRTSSFAATGSSVMIPGGTGFANLGFNFSGWNTAANGSGTSYAASSSITLSSSTTLFAQWSRTPAPSCAVGSGRGGIKTGTVSANKGGNGCVGISFQVGGVSSMVTFNYTGSNQSWTVPIGVTSATFYLIGAGGGGGVSFAGGGGGYATGSYAVTAGQTLTVIVGQGGGGADAVTRPGVSGYPGIYTPVTYGGGGRGGSFSAGWDELYYSSGGGRSAIRLPNTSTDLATAGGGSGAAYSQCGLGGGGLTGNGSTRGGTQSAGGTGAGSGNGYPGTNGIAYQGGDSKDEGGGGGGGFFGGGGGGDNTAGGGGSSYVALLTNGVTNAGGDCGAAAATTGLDYLVTYDANTATSGTVPTRALVAMTGGTLTLASNTGSLAKTDFTFGGWNTAANGSGTSYAVGATTFIPSGDATLYAQWNSTITYNGNGQTSASSTVPGATTARGSSNTTLANAGTMARSNFTFAGWNTQAVGLGTNYASGLTTYTSTGNTTLFARWIATITYDPNGGTGSPATSSSNSAARTSDQIVNTLAPIALSNLPTVGTMVRPGFTFGGWNTAANGTGTNFSPNFSVTDPINPRPYMRFKASDFNDATNAWADSSGNNRNIPGTPVTATAGNIRGNPTLVDATGNGSTATFKAVKGDGSGTAPESADGIVIGNEALSSYTFCHVARYAGLLRGRIFAGVTGNWLSGYWGSSAGVAHPEAWITSSSGANDTNWRVMCHTGGTTSGFRSNGVVRTTVTSNTTELPANITINLQGSRTAPGDQSDWEVAEFVIYSGILNTFQIETIEESLKTTYGISGYTSPTTPATAGSFTPTGNTILYARWLPNAYNLTFDTSTATSGSVEGRWFSAGTTFTLPTNTLARAGYTFRNWNTAANGSGTTYTTIQSVTLFDNLTLHPQWNLIAPGVPTVITDSGNTEVTVTPTPAAASGTTVGPTTSMLVTTFNSTGGALGSSTVTNRALASNVATLTTSTAHNLKVGDRVIIAGVATAFNGTYTVASVPTSTTFTYATTGQTNVTAVSSTGSATVSRTCTVVSPATSCVITGLTNGTTYQFAATATNATGTSGSSTKVNGLPAGVVVTYNTSSNSGIIGTSGTTTTSSETFNKGSSLTLPVASRTGYEFSGWFNAATGGSLIGGPGGSYSPSLSASITTRSLTNNVATLTTSSAHGFVVGMTVTVINVDATFNGSYTITSVPTATTFTYAKTANNVTSASVTPSGRATITALTVFAQFVGLTYTITYNGNGNTGGEVPPRGSVQVGGSAHVINGATTPPTKTGFTFDGWYTTSTGTGGTAFAVGASYSTAANLNLFARWTANTNAISYNRNGGSGSLPISGSFVSGAATPYTVLSKPNDLTKTGSEFIGWNTALDGSGTSYSAGASLTTLTETILYAQWGVSTYSYSYQLNGGTSAEPAPGTAIYNASITLPAAPTRTGFTFAGWNDGTNTIPLATTSVNITTNRIFVAQWTAESFTITFDGNSAFGGVATSGSVTSGTFVAGGVPYSIAANGFTKDGYNFAGWKNAAGTSFVVGSGYSTLANLTLIAQWTPASYTITYNANGATSGTAPTSGTLTTGTVFTAAANPTPALTKTGYTFTRWNTKADGSGSSFAPGAAVTALSNLTLFAEWTVISPTITYLPGQVAAGVNSGASVPPQTSAAFGTEYTILNSLSATVTVGDPATTYSFVGWTSGGITYQPLSKYRMSTVNLELTAVWQKVLQVRYVLNGGSQSGDNKEFEAECTLFPENQCGVKTENGTTTPNLTITLNTAPSRDGYNFLGWKTPGMGSSDAPLVAGASYTLNENNYIFYAQWSAVAQTLSFNENGGSSPQPSIQNKIIGDIQVLPTPTFTRAGYTFGGWSDGTSTYPAGGSFTVGNGDQAFSAVWVGNTNTITYNGNGATGGTAPSNGSFVTGSSTPYTVSGNTGNLVKENFDFDGWYTTASGTGGTGYAVTPAGTFVTTTNITLYAKWTATPFAVTYQTGDSAIAAPTQAATIFGSSFVLAAAPTRSGFNFLGWETGSGATALLYAPGSTYTMGLSATTFTAKWSGLSYVVVYQLNGGAANPALTQISVGHDRGFTTAAAPTRTGFTFTGWSDGTTLISALTPVEKVTSNKTLTAQWTIAAPGIPGTPTAAPGNGSATITIVAPTTGGTPSSYTVTAFNSSNQSVGTCTVTAPSTSCTIAPLNNGTPYTFTSTATNTAGNSTSGSTASAAVTPAGVPLSPSSITGSGTGGSTTINWTAPTSDGGSPITDYVIEFRVTGSATWTTFTDGTSTATSATVTGLTAGSAYEFRVSAKNLIGDSLPSFTSPVVEALPMTPVITSVTGASEKVTVTWNASSHLGSGTLTDYEVTAYDAEGNAAGSCNPASGQLTCAVTGLVNGSSYTFKVAAITTVGSSAQSSASNVVVPAGVPSAPANVVAVTSGSNMTVTFTAPESTGGSAITSYIVTPSPATVGASCSATPATSTTYTCTGLAAGTNYSYSVKAVNSTGESSASVNSEAVTAVAVPSAPLNVSAVIEAGTTTLSATVSFDPPASENGSPVTSYTVTASPGGATCTVDAPRTYCDIPVLPDRVYTFTATATSAVGTSAASSPSPQTKATNGIEPTLVNDPIPAPTGDRVEKKVLNSNVGVNSFNSTPNSVVTYQWKLCDDPLIENSCTDISGATSATYTLTSSDIDKFIRVEVTATNSMGDITKLSEATGVIVSASGTPSTPTQPTADPTPVGPSCDAACRAIRDAAVTKAAADAAAKVAADKAAADAAARLRADADARLASDRASVAARAAADAARAAVERAGAAAAAKAAADAAAATAAAQARAAADAQAAANRAAAAAQAALRNAATDAAARATATAAANRAAADAQAAVRAAATAAQNATRAKTAETNANRQVDIAINSLTSRTASAQATAEANAIAAAAKAAANEAAAAAALRATEARANAAAAQRAAADAAARIATEQREAATAAAAARAATEAAARASAEKTAATTAVRSATETLAQVLNEKATLAEQAANATDTKTREEILRKLEEIEARLEQVEDTVEEAQDAAEEAEAEFEEASDVAEEAQEIAAQKAQDAIEVRTEAASKTAAASRAAANATVAGKVAAAARAAAARVPSRAVIAAKPSTSTNKNSAKATISGLKPGQKVKVTVNVKPRP